VAVVQYTFTHKQYTEQHKKQYIEQHKKQYIEQHKKQYIEQHKNKLEQCEPCSVLVKHISNLHCITIQTSELKCQNVDMFRLFVGHPQAVYIIIFIKHRLSIDKIG
jgi:UTP:GlnB (protein PII) uridylyltransferase